MRVALLNLEPQIKNYALEKLKLYHEQKGDECFLEYGACMDRTYDVIYCSSIFTDTDKSYVPQNAICGGTGFDVKSKLPPEVDALRPKSNYGFCSRGCIRNCSFCVVREKEGYIKEEADIYDIWDGKSKDIILYDNNILALPDHFKRICEQLHQRRIRIDFNQGLDIRLVDNDIADLLSTKYISHAQYHFAFDYSTMDELIEEKIKILKGKGINRSVFYVLTGFPIRPEQTVKENIEDTLYRLNMLRSLGQNASVMRYKKVYDGQPESLITAATQKYYIPVANWGSVHGVFRGMSFIQYLNEHERGMPYKRFINDLGLYL